MGFTKKAKKAAKSKTKSATKSKAGSTAIKLGKKQAINTVANPATQFAAETAYNKARGRKGPKFEGKKLAIAQGKSMAASPVARYAYQAAYRQGVKHGMSGGPGVLKKAMKGSVV